MIKIKSIINKIENNSSNLYKFIIERKKERKKEKSIDLFCINTLINLVDSF